ncbi:MAG: DUF2092 domain-containing protein [Deltaproteobacteria bacterium]|nr:DUF2092 domain-containing protein [Deltaproteobacteria bacterium]
MRTSIAAIVLLLASAAAAQAPSAHSPESDPPEKVAELFLKALNCGADSLKAVLPFVTAKARKFFEDADKDREKVGTSEGPDEVTGIEIVETMIQNGEATVRASVSTCDAGTTVKEEMTLVMRKENGAWRVFKFGRSGMEFDLERLREDGLPRIPSDIATAERVRELEKRIAAYRARTGEYPASSRVSSSAPSGSNGINEGVEQLALALRAELEGKADGIFSAEWLSDTDADASPRAREESGAGAEPQQEFCDAWGNPLVYIHHRDYGKTFRYMDSEGGQFEVEARMSAWPDEFCCPRSYQLWSLGMDLANQNGDGDDIPNWKRTGQAVKFDSWALPEYERMIKAVKDARTLSYTSKVSWDNAIGSGFRMPRVSYSAWLSKPNYFRIEAVGDNGKLEATIVGTGEEAFTFWPGDRPRLRDQDEKAYRATRKMVYMKERAPPGYHSIGHLMAGSGAFVGMPVINPSLFHGCESSLDRYFDGVRFIGQKDIDGEPCIGIEASYQNRLRLYYYWIAKKDSLPRLLRSVYRGQTDSGVREKWIGLAVNAGIPAEKFKWTPPEGWKEWEPEPYSEKVIEPGADAPDFDLETLDGGRLKLSSLKGKVVWLYIWGIG